MFSNAFGIVQRQGGKFQGRNQVGIN